MKTSTKDIFGFLLMIFVIGINSIPIIYLYFSRKFLNFFDFSLLIGLWWYLGWFVVFCLITYLFTKDIEKFREILQIIYIFATITVLFTSVFVVVAIRKDKELNMKKYLCEEYKINIEIAESSIKALNEEQISNEYFQTFALQKYFQDYSYLFSDKRSDLNLDYRRLLISNNRLERLDILENDPTITLGGLKSAAIWLSLIDKERKGTKIGLVKKF